MGNIQKIILKMLCKFIKKYILKLINKKENKSIIHKNQTYHQIKPIKINIKMNSQY